MKHRVVLGTAGLGGASRPVNPERSMETIIYALKKGIRNIDTAPAYMDAEEIVGKALSQWRGEQVFLSTKVGKKSGRSDEAGLNDYRIPFMEKSLVSSLTKLSRSKIDLLFLHEPNEVPITEVENVVKTLRSFKEQGMASYLGLGGKIPLHFFKYIEEGYFDVAMDFNGYNLVETNALETIFPIFKKGNLQIYEGSPLMMGLLGRRWPAYTKDPPAWLQPSTVKRAITMKSLADSYKIQLSEMAHRFLFYNRIIDKVVIGPVVFEQLEATINDFEQGPLPEALLREMGINTESNI